MNANPAVQRRIKDVTGAALLLGVVLTVAVIFILTGCVGPRRLNPSKVMWRPDSIRPIQRGGIVVGCLLEGYDEDNYSRWMQVQCPPPPPVAKSPSGAVPGTLQAAPGASRLPKAARKAPQSTPSTQNAPSAN